MTTTAAASRRQPATADRDAPVVKPEPAPDGPTHSGESTWQRGRRLADRVVTALRNEPALVAVLVSSFLARWLIADRNSYWLDEFLSVHVYGHWHDSPGDAVTYLASNSVHPPLYQFVLWFWMDWFGDSERATRSLSNLFIMLATLFLYLLVREAFSRRLALASAITFALMYTPLYYALEARSYALTLFLAVLSSFALLRIMRAGLERGWRSALLSPAALVFHTTGAALLLTHYFNAFFWVAQGILAGLFVLRERPVRGWPAGLATLAACYTLQAGVFAAIWGGVLLDEYHSRRGGAFSLEQVGTRSPYQLLDSIVAPNLDPPGVIRWAGLVIAGVMLLRAAYALANRGAEERRRAWVIVYLVGWLVLPFYVITVVFEVVGLARYLDRYWLAAMPPLAPLLVLTVNELVGLVRAGLRRVSQLRLPPVWTTVAIAAAVATLVAPGTLAAATAPKGEYRDIAVQVVDIIRADPDHDYLLYEAGFRRGPLINHYFHQLSDQIEAHAVLKIAERETGRYRILNEEEPLVAEHDYLVVLFPQLTVKHFQDAMAQLADRYETRLRQLDRQGCGFVIFDVNRPGGSNEPSP